MALLFCLSWSRIARCSLALALAITLDGCETTPPREMESSEEYAFLQNRYEIQGGSGFKYLYEYANGKKLSQGFWSLDLEGPRDLVHRIQPGETVLGVWIEYFPTSPRYPYAAGRPSNYDIYVRDVGGVYENERMTEAERANFGAWSGLSIDAKAGQIYQVGCRIEDGKAYVWIEAVGGEADGEIVSEVVPGLAITLFDRVWGIWQRLPDPLD